MDILEAAITNDMLQAALYVHAGGSVNKSGSLGVTPLVAAIRNSNPDMVQLLLDNEADPYKYVSTLSPLEHAVEQASLPCAQRVFEHMHDREANVDILSESLGFAILYGHMEMIDWLLDVGADPYRKVGVSQLPIIEAVSMYSAEEKENIRNVISHILRRRPLEDPVDMSNIVTHLTHKPEAHVKDLFDPFLQHGLDPNEKTSSDAPFLLFCASRKNTTMVDLLLQAGADPDATDALGNTLSTYGYTND